MNENIVTRLPEHADEDDIVTRLREHADEEKKAGAYVLRDALSDAADEIIRLRRETGWYKAVNTQLRDDLIQANADFQALARTPAPTFDPLEAIVLGLKRENDARKSH